MDVTAGSIHWLYLAFVGAIIVLLSLRRDTTIACLLGIGAIGWLASGSASGAVGGLFNSLIYAIKELSGTILIISIIVAMSRLLVATGINEIMVSPFARLLRSPAMAYWGIGLIMMTVSFFFWPSPAVALIGAVLLPVAIRVGLPALGAAMAMNLFGHGIALSGDYVIQGAPKLTADAAGIGVAQVMEASVPLVIVMGLTTTVAAFWFMRRDMKTGAWRDGLVQPSSGTLFGAAEDGASGRSGGDGDRAMPLPLGAKRAAAVAIPLLFALDVYLLFRLNLQGGDATALIGGTAALIVAVLSLLAHRGRGLEKSTTYLVDGFTFGFKVFGPVIPIAAFFYLGDSALPALFGESALPAGSHGIVNDLGALLAHTVPVSGAFAAGTLTAVGAITGLDGSGFSGISLAGSVASLFGTALGHGTDVLTALGQIAAIWVGGGTLIPWALIPAAAICGVSPFELARRNLKPVAIGLVVTTVVAVFLL
ncbi:putative membrane protein [Paenibacillus pasadenensis]|uniref:Putative membrane protein n=1 Tax=Paenibacillus pasadenensis TaxID=217090 RepID=A0A2N5N6Y2_9BACL|nr:hypothetical protein [Paenibacillus pasadenensis]PLT46070.1 putative membrane protein [Paenibacillus pasadenensis]